MQISSGKHASSIAIGKIFFLTAVLVILASCNQDKPSKTDSTTPQSTTNAAAATAAGGDLPDPCKLLTRAEAEAILGEPVREPEPGSLGGNRICDYKTVTVHGGVLPYSIHIAIIAESQQVWDAGKKLHQQSDAREMRAVAGIGDDAYFLLDDLQILTKQRYVSINVMKSIDKPDHAKAVEEAEMAVAQKIMPRM